MKIQQTEIPDCYVIEPEIHKDHRGVFFESFNKAELEKQLGRPLHFVQDNHSLSKKGVLRGLHFQAGEYAQAKLVRVVRGAVQDVVVDLRRNSPVYGRYLSMELSGTTGKMLYIPRGAAHGFLALEDQTVFLYKCDNYYHKASERGIIYNDPDLGIHWKCPKEQLILSEKDKRLSSFKEYMG